MILSGCEGDRGRDRSGLPVAGAKVRRAALRCAAASFRIISTNVT